jgi:F-type H+-transporting ATPase subunit b
VHIDWFTFTAQIVNFLILVFLLQRFLYKPILKAMDTRERKIASQLEEAERMRKEAEAEVENLHTLKRELAEKREEMISQAKAEAELKRKEFLEKALSEVEALQNRWREGLAREMEAFLQDVRKRVCREVFGIARRALEDLAKADVEQRIIEVFLERIKGMDEEMRKGMVEATQKASSKILVQSAFEVSPEARRKITDSLKSQIAFDGVNVHYETTPEMILGIELQVQSRKIAWSLEGYLESLEENVSEAFERETRRASLQIGQRESSGALANSEH